MNGMVGQDILRFRDAEFHLLHVPKLLVLVHETGVVGVQNVVFSKATFERAETALRRWQGIAQEW